jgi:NhaP-type Na+/H+ or K+/H+ antiporter
MNDPNLALFIVAATILVLGIVAGYIKNRLWVSEPLLALLVGVLIGPAVLDLVSLDLTEDRELEWLHQVARVTLSMSVMGAALRLPRAYERRHWREIAVILGVGMPLMWFGGSLLFAWVLGLPALTAMLIAAIVAPTDPVLSDSIITGRTAEESVPRRMRDSLSMESGANDGLALLIVLLPLALLTRPPDEAWSHWFEKVLLWEVIGAVVLGVASGWLAGTCWDWAHRQTFSEKGSLMTVSLSLTLAVLSGATLIDIDGILAVFVAGLTFNHFVEKRETQLEDLQESLGRFFDLPVFILFGLVLPWSEWLELGGWAIAGTLLVLFVRRVPAWLLLQRWLPSLHGARDALFNGWFGPVGIAALFYATHAERSTDQPIVWTVASLVIFGSIVVHGVTATPLCRAFGARESSRSRERSTSGRSARDGDSARRLNSEPR